MEAVDWRTNTSKEFRGNFLEKIVNNLKKHVPSDEHHLSEMKNIAVKFEEKVYMIATDEEDYVRKIVVKLMAIEKSRQNVVRSSLTSNPSYSDPGKSLAVQSTDQSQEHEQHSLPNIPSNISSAGVSTKLASAWAVSVSDQVPLLDSASKTSYSQKSVGNSSGHGAPLNVSANNLKLEHRRQHSAHITSQQNHEQLNPLLYKKVKQEQIDTKQNHEQENPHLCKQIKQESIVTQQNYEQLNPHLCTPIKQEHMAASCITLEKQLLQPHNQQFTDPDLQSQKEPSLIGRRLTATNIQQNQLTDPDLHQQQYRLACQQNNAQKQLQGQKINVSDAQHEQSNQRKNISIQQRSQHASSYMHQCEVEMQGGTQQTASALLPNQGLQSQPQTLERQLNSSQEKNMQRQGNSVEQDRQQKHQMTGLPASTLRQGEFYRKVEILKSKYLRPLTVIFQRLAYCLQNLERLDIKKVEAVKSSYQTVKSIFRMLNVPESIHTPPHKEKLAVLEKKIIDILHQCGQQQPVSSQQHGQLYPDVHSMRQLVQLNSQTPQAQTHQDEKKPRSQSVNIKCFTKMMQQSNVTNLVVDDSEPPILQHGTIHLQNNLTEKDSDQANSLNLVHQGSSGSLKIPTSSPQQQNVMTLLSRNSIHGPQSNVKPFESSFSVPQDVHLKQSLEQQNVQTQNPKQEVLRHKMQQQVMQPKQQILKQHYRLVKLQSGAFPNPLPENRNSSRQQVSKYTSQSEKNNIPIHLTKVRTPFNSKNSPSRISLAPFASSPMPADSEKPMSDTPSHSNAGNIGDQQVKGAPEAPSLSVISTPGLSASHLLEMSNDGIRCNKSTVDSDEVQPIQQLIKVVNFMSSKALSACASDIGSVVCMTDRISGPVTVQGSTVAICEDLVAMTNFHLQERYSTWQDKTFKTRIMKRPRSTFPIIDAASETGSINDSLLQLSEMEKFDLESTAICHIKRPRLEVNQTLLEEIRTINQRLIHTVLDISDEETTPSVTSAPIKDGEGTIVRCSFVAVAIRPNLMSEQVSAPMFPLQPLRLLVPANYPFCSPIFLDKLTVEVRDELEDLSAKVKSKLYLSLRTLTEPLSLVEIARIWDTCARAVICEYAEQKGGGSFTSKYGTWEDCLTVA